MPERFSEYCGDVTEIEGTACYSTHVCEKEEGHDDEHECECGITWDNEDDDHA